MRGTRLEAGRQMKKLLQNPRHELGFSATRVLGQVEHANNEFNWQVRCEGPIDGIHVVTEQFFFFLNMFY